MRGVGERRRPGHFRICPSCGKRNKARRSACARCREPLRGLPEALPGAPPGKLTYVPISRRNRWLAAGGVVLAIAAGVGVHRLFRSGTIAPAGQTLTVSPPDAPEAETAGTPASTPPEPTAAEVRNAAERGERLLARGDARGAASILSDAAQSSPDDPRIANAYGRALLALGSRDRALIQFEKAARLASGVVAYRLDYARALGSAGRAREAAREYEAVSALEPGNAAAAAGLAGVSSPAPGTAGASVDLGGASRTPETTAGAPSTSGGVFTNEDLSRGAPRPSPSIPASLRSPSPRIIREGPSPLPSPS